MIKYDIGNYTVLNFFDVHDTYGGWYDKGWCYTVMDNHPEWDDDIYTDFQEIISNYVKIYFVKI